MDEIACTLNSDDFNRRRVELLPGLIARSAACEELPDGLRWRFAPEDGLLAQIATVIDAERRCCRFLRFEVIVEPNGGAICVSATGPAGTREFLGSLT